MTEEEIFKNVWNETHHFKLTLANGEILDLIDLKFYTDLLGKYSEIKAENEKIQKENQQLKEQLELSEKARKEAIEFINNINDWEICSKYDCIYQDDVLEILKKLDVDKGE